jgi:acyl carrier protein
MAAPVGPDSPVTGQPEVREWHAFAAAMADVARLPSTDVTREARLIADLGLDSFALAEVAVELSIQFGVDQLLGELDWSSVTVGQLYDTYARLSSATRIARLADTS